MEKPQKKRKATQLKCHRARACEKPTELRSSPMMDVMMCMRCQGGTSVSLCFALGNPKAQACSKVAIHSCRMAAQAAAQMCAGLSVAPASRQARVNLQPAVCFRSGAPVVHPPRN